MQIYLRFSQKHTLWKWPLRWLLHYILSQIPLFFRCLKIFPFMNSHSLSLKPESQTWSLCGFTIRQVIVKQKEEKNCFTISCPGRKKDNLQFLTSPSLWPPQKHCKNCECCPCHSLFKGHKVIVYIVVLNCQQCN